MHGLQVAISYLYFIYVSSTLHGVKKNVLFVSLGIHQTEMSHGTFLRDKIVELLLAPHGTDHNNQSF